MSECAVKAVKRMGKRGWCVQKVKAPFNYWNGSWSLGSFGDQFAKVYPSQAAALRGYRRDCVIAALLK